MLHRAPTRVVLGLILVGSAVSSPAGEGALEINMACATNGGCFPGDAAGLPVEIADSSNARSYELTGDLEVTSTSAIEITVPDVTLDLNGHSIRGPTSCTGTPVSSCSPTTFGAQAIAAGNTAGVRVMNGTIRGSPDTGVDLGGRSVVSDIRVVESGSDGIAVGEDSLVTNVTSHRNLQHGIQGDDRSTVDRSRASGNGQNGFLMLNASLVTRSTVVNNGFSGMSALRGSVVRSSVSRGNEEVGVKLYQTTGSVIDTTITNNSGLGVQCALQSGAAIRGLVLDGNNAGGDQFSSKCIEIGTNLCGGDTNCP
jgi:DNA-binding cell septation regulator SpoVG